MDMTSITTMIGSVGFPIVMCLLMYRELDELRGTISDLKDTISANTTIISKLCERLNLKED